MQSDEETGLTLLSDVVEGISPDVPADEDMPVADAMDVDLGS